MQNEQVISVNKLMSDPIKIQTYREIYHDLQESIETVLHQHAIKKIEQRLAKAQQNLQQWEAKYGCDYDTFTVKTSTDIAYVNALNDNFETIMWESDLLEWEVDAEVLRKWKQHLQKLSPNL